MNIKRYMHIVLILLILLSISAVSAADDASNDIIGTNDNEELILDETIDDDVSSANNNQRILEENIDNVEAPLSNTLSEEDSIEVTDSASGNIQTNANENQAQNNNDVEQKDSSSKNILFEIGIEFKTFIKFALDFCANIFHCLPIMHFEKLLIGIV